MSPQGVSGETATIYRLCQLFKANPSLHYRSIVIKEDGHVDIACDGASGVVKEWARALPAHRETEGLANTAYGWTEAVVLTEGPITVTVRPPLIPGGVMS